MIAEGTNNLPPDRVIDAAIPAKCLNCNYELQTHIEEVGGYVPCEYCWLKEEVARLEAEKEAAHTELDTIKLELMVVYGCDSAEVAWDEIELLIKKYFPPPPKPTAAKPEPSPSSANRGEGRQG